MKRIFIVEDHAVVRDTFQKTIEHNPELVVCGTAASFEEARAAIPEAGPDLVTMDVSLGRDAPDGIELIRQLIQAMPPQEHPCWIVVSLHDDVSTRERARAAGADAFLSKRGADTTLVEAIRSVLPEGQRPGDNV